MEDTKLANSPRFAVKTDVNGGSTPGEEGRIIELLEVVPSCLAGILLDLEIDTLSLEAFLMCDEGSAQHQQDTVEEAVNGFEAAGLAAESRRPAPMVRRFSLLVLVLQDNIRGLENLERESHRLVLTDCLEQTG